MVEVTLGKYTNGDLPPLTDFNAIVEAHSDAVWRTAYRLLNNYEDALDCYQEAFLTAKRLSCNQEVRHWRTMLQRIAMRKALDMLRRRYRGEKALGNLARSSPGCSALDSPDARCQGEELRDQVRRALATLPAQQAEAFWLRHIEQLTPNEVAELMDIESGHARVLVHRAAVRLRTLAHRIGETLVWTDCLTRTRETFFREKTQSYVWNTTSEITNRMKFRTFSKRFTQRFFPPRQGELLLRDP